jgi:hypothetical protein
MKKKFVEGQRVATMLDENDEFTSKLRYDGEYSDGPEFGKVVDTEFCTKGKVKVLWDNDYLNATCNAISKTTGKKVPPSKVAVEMDIKVLLTEEEAKEKFASLEKEYDAVAKEVRAKLTEAGKLVKEANKIAKKAGVDSLADMYDAVDPLVDAMDACGWRSSSWSC